MAFRFSVTDSKGIESGSGNSMIKQNICQVFGQLPIEKRLVKLNQLMLENPTVYVSTAAQFIQKEYYDFIESLSLSNKK